ncbi:hypothetical protein [Nostoc sp. CMAA1605]|uniref:hypothetical protein n=1 Tax=Nostoc sp. CMAA1605 TaxID=2055159 RepID=UPI001F341EE4|nr:hypothetical protein [Nostoc sp. CMAA1605]
MGIGDWGLGTGDWRLVLSLSKYWGLEGRQGRIYFPTQHRLNNALPITALITHYSLLTTHYSALSTQHSALSTHYSTWRFEFFCVFIL